MTRPAFEIGIDLVEIRKVRQVFGENRALQESVFTPAEMIYSMRQRDPFVHLAVRFAVKEALFKALGTGLSGEMDWRDVEIDEESPGRPVVSLQGRTAQGAREKGIVRCAVSLSCTKNYATALVILVAGAAVQDHK